MCTGSVLILHRLINANAFTNMKEICLDFCTAESLRHYAGGCRSAVIQKSVSKVASERSTSFTSFIEQKRFQVRLSKNEAQEQCGEETGNVGVKFIWKHETEIPSWFL